MYKITPNNNKQQLKLSCEVSPGFYEGVDGRFCLKTAGYVVDLNQLIVYSEKNVNLIAEPVKHFSVDFEE